MCVCILRCSDQMPDWKIKSVDFVFMHLSIMHFKQKVFIARNCHWPVKTFKVLIVWLVVSKHSKPECFGANYQKIFVVGHLPCQIVSFCESPRFFALFIHETYQTYQGFLEVWLVLVSIHFFNQAFKSDFLVVLFSNFHSSRWIVLYHTLPQHNLNM